MNMIDVNELEHITARQLRQILFNVQDQDTTVAALREMLFAVPEQDRAYSINHAMFYRMQYDTESEQRFAEIRAEQAR